MKSFLLRTSLALGLFFAAARTASAAADYATPYFFSTLAGDSSIGSTDGPGNRARFFSPKDLATDTAGNIFVVDEGNHTIRKVTPAGVVSTFAGSPGQPGSVDGTGGAARFDSPQGIVVDATDNLYVTDTGNHTIRKITPTGVVTTLAGLADVTGSADGTGADARFNLPRKIARDVTGNLYVTETGNRAIRKITAAGVVSTYFTTGLAFPEDFNGAYGAIAVDGAGNVYVSTFTFSDTRISGPNPSDSYTRYFGFVLRITPAGLSTSLWQTSIYRYADGRVENSSTCALAIDPAGDLVSGTGYRVMKYNLTTGTFTGLAGSGQIGSGDGSAADAKFGSPFGLRYDRNGVLYVADTGNNNLRKVTADGTVSTFAGLALEAAADYKDGTGSAARFINPAGIVADAAGNLYVTEPAAHCIRKITPAGAVTTFAGLPRTAGFVDGPGSAARFSSPTALAIDAAGTLYVADTNNHTIRKISPAGETSTLAGLAGSYGWQDGAGSAAQFWSPYGVAVDSTGNVYVTSAGTVRKITPAGVTTTLAGHESDVGYADGFGDAARFAVPSGITVDATGNLYVTEAPDGPAIARIRKITPAGSVTTVAGAEHGYADGSGTAARFHNPYTLAIDATGALIIADSFNQSVRKLTLPGTVTTLAGLADAPGGADGTGREARFFYPRGVATGAAGTLYVTSGTTIRKGVPATLPAIATQPAGTSVTAGTSASFSVTAGGTPAPTFQWQRNGSAIAGATGSSFTLSSAQTSDAGDYTVVVSNALGNVTSAKATLAVTAAPVSPPPAPPSGGGGSAGGSGGGAPSSWFLLALLSLGATRRLVRSAGGWRI